jgi:3-dehydroquinate dehydratase-2
MSIKLLVINGPNLNLLGSREPEIYGYDTLADIEARCQALVQGYPQVSELTFRQSNHEGELVTWIQQAIADVDGIIINAGAYTHTSVAIHDALRAYAGKKIELHISNPHLREPFRHVSYLAAAVDGVIAGLGVAGYEHAVSIMIDRLLERT